MTWHSLHWPSMAAGWYCEYLEDVALRIYRFSFSELQKASEQRKKTIEANPPKSGNDEEWADFNGTLHYEDDRWLEEQRAISAMALALIATRTISFLTEMKSLFKGSDPPQRKYRTTIPGQEAEYSDRFRIDLRKGVAGFGAVEEVLLARNHCSHPYSGALKEYKDKTQQRFLDEGENISFTPDVLQTVVGELQQFANDLAEQLRAFQKAASKAASQNGKN